MFKSCKSYDEALRFLDGVTVRKVKNLRETFVAKKGEDLEVWYHDTAVVTYFRDGTIMLNTGGFDTATTKRRINDFSPAKIFSRNYVWFLEDSEGKTVEFFDEMIVDRYGDPIPEYREEDSYAVEATVDQHIRKEY